MQEELKALTALCKIPQRESVRKQTYDLLSRLGVKPSSRSEDGRQKLLAEYLWRKYKMGGSAGKLVYKFLKQKFPPAKLKKSLGRE